MNYNKEAKGLTFRRGSEVSQVMTISLDVGLLSGETATVTVGLDEDVKAIQHLAEVALGLGARNGRLLDTFGRVLDSYEPIKTAQLQNGDSLTLHIGRVQSCASHFALAAILGDGSVVT